MTHKLIEAAKYLQAQLRQSRKLDIRKDFSLINADAQLSKLIHEIESDQTRHADQIEEARLCYEDDDTKIPPHPMVAPADDGAVWVEAWVRIAPDTDTEQQP